MNTTDYGRHRGRRETLTVERAEEAARTLMAVADGSHPVGDNPRARALATRKLGELLDEVDALVTVRRFDDVEMAAWHPSVLDEAPSLRSVREA